MTLSAESDLGIFWWNTHNFFHYDAARKGDRWPSSPGVYIEKCNRVDNALMAFFENYNKPEIIAFCEITNRASEDLKNRLLADYNFLSLDAHPLDPSSQISIFYKEKDFFKITEINPIVVEDTPNGTRPMAVIDIEFKSKIIRLIACHWQARFKQQNGKYKVRVADYLSKYIYDFITENDSIKSKDVILIGDLNEEPFDEIPSDYLNSHRFRDRATKSIHWTDKKVKRINLYNCTWRLLGEKHPAQCTKNLQIAGSYYWEDEKSWHTLDQILATSGLIGASVPRLDEDSTHIVSMKEFLPESLPKKFSYSTVNGYKGLSDHLPIYTKLTHKALL